MLQSDSTKAKIERFKLTVRGIVQGVGFRPFVFNLAKGCGLTGSVFNNGDGVEIDIQGERTGEFITRLSAEAPPLVMLVSMQQSQLEVEAREDFHIIPSEASTVSTACIPPDIALCDDCLREMFDPGNRRYRYPFINCTNCGPRYTITGSIPYDRPFTSMREFEMCTRCRAEYENPSDRRFHAQPNACPDCGPALQYKSSSADAGGSDSFDDSDDVSLTETALSRAIEDLKAGRIVAVRGLGGYHLAVDARNDKAVQRLRQRKHRYGKPLAIMADSLETVRQLCEITPAEAELLQSPAHPVVILPKQETSADNNPSSEKDICIAPSVSIDNPTLGVMLPYTPMHHLLLRGNFRALVMTSANISEEPICIGIDEAESRMAGIADSFLHHNREILIRCDDSVYRVFDTGAVPVRRARGQVPRPIILRNGGPPVLAVGAELKNTLCISNGRSAFLSQHIGDLENLETLSFFEEAAGHLMDIFGVRPIAIAHDMHPNYLGTNWATAASRTESRQTLSEPRQKLSGLQQSLSGLPRIPVQHHHAHLVSCLAENGTDEKAIGIILDGTGYGTDGSSWGGEFLVGNSHGFERAGHFEVLPLPGGNITARQPWRMAMSYLHAIYGDRLREALPAFFNRLSEKQIEASLFLLRSELNSPPTSSCGRLFDAVASLLGLHDEVAFEAQAAISLEHCAAGRNGQAYPFRLVDVSPFMLSFLPAIQEIANDMRDDRDREDIAASFHATVIQACLQAAELIRNRSGLAAVALSGGVFQNKLILEGLSKVLREYGFSVFVHSQVPANDGGIALGQAVIAQSRMRG